jgi:uncharacterized protein YbjQ (UPF0145 family)
MVSSIARGSCARYLSCASSPAYTVCGAIVDRRSIIIAHSAGAFVEHALTTTAFTLDGYKVIRNLGVVRGITVRSRSIFGTIGGSLQTIVGGNISLFTSLCEKTRAEAFEMMLTHAGEVGANAVIGIRYDATELMSGVTEVLCYGTAVVVTPSAS